MAFAVSMYSLIIINGTNSAGGPGSLLEVSVAAGDPGPVIVLAGEADRSSVSQLNEVLTAQLSARTRCLTIDATNLRSIDQTTAQALMLAALIVIVQGGRAVLVNPREQVLQVLNRSRVTEMFTVQDQAPAHTAPDSGMDGGFSERAM
jgi:anti-anti-sigma factor